MKRSRNVALVIVGAAALGACDGGDPSETVFQSVADCRQFYDEDICRTKVVEAEKLHAESAPKYASRESCEAAFGKEACVPTEVPPGPETQTAAPGGQTGATPGQTPTPQTHAGGGSWFMPAMMGFMLGRALSPPLPLYYGPQSLGGQDRPLYSGRSFYGTTPAGGRTAFQANAPRSSTRVATAPSTASRGGFGSTGRSYSGGSGS